MMYGNKCNINQQGKKLLMIIAKYYDAGIED